MVRTLNVPMDDNEFSYIKEVKQRSGLSWEEFLLEAVSAYEVREEEED